MSRPVNISDTLTFNPTGYTGATNMSLSNPTYGYHGSDWTSNYATINLSSTTSGYVYFTFAISDIPSNATITSVTCSVRERANQSNRVSNASIQLYSNTTAKGSATTTSLSTTATVYNITNAGIWTVSELSNIRLRINGQRANSQNSGNIRFYGATLTINYSVSGIEYEVSVTNNSETVDSVSPSGTNYVVSGEDITIQINADDISSIEVFDNDTNINASLVQHSEDVANSTSTVLGTYSLVSGSFNGSGESYFSGIVGNGVDATQTTSNYYSGGSGTIAVFTYDLSFSNIPSNATITRLYVQVNGHAESTSNSSEYMCAQLISGSTELSDEYNFKDAGSTSNSTQTIETTTLPSVSQLSSLKLQCRLGYYGGAINGATCYVEYTIPSSTPSYYYTYTISNISGDHSIVIADAAATPYFMKVNGEYRPVKKFFRKVDGEWVEIDVSQLSIAGPFFYKGWQEEIIYNVIGEVTRSSSDTSIVINDNALSSGNYTLYYEDEGNNILSDVDEIANITIS